MWTSCSDRVCDRLGYISVDHSDRSIRKAFAKCFPKLTAGILSKLVVLEQATFHCAEGSQDAGSKVGSVCIHLPVDMDSLREGYPSFAELLGYLHSVLP